MITKYIILYFNTISIKPKIFNGNLLKHFQTYIKIKMNQIMNKVYLIKISDNFNFKMKFKI